MPLILIWLNNHLNVVISDDLIFDLSKLENVNNRNRGVEEENKNNITDEEESESEESEDDYYERKKNVT